MGRSVAGIIAVSERSGFQEDGSRYKCYSVVSSALCCFWLISSFVKLVLFFDQKCDRIISALLKLVEAICVWAFKIWIYEFEDSDSQLLLCLLAACGF